MQCARDFVFDCAMGSIVVVASSPIFQLFGRIGKAHEPVSVQAFGSELGSLNASMKPLSVGLPGRENSSVTCLGTVR